LLEDIRLLHGESSGTYGSRRIYAVLRGHGRRIGRSWIERLTRRAGLRGLAARLRRTRTIDSRHGYPIAWNRLGRNFMARRPTRSGSPTRPTSPPAKAGSILPASRLRTRKLVGWSTRETLHTEVAIDALNMAIERQQPAPGLIRHSDRGIQYAAEAYRLASAWSGITPSMSRKGDCWGNARMESFHTLKTERRRMGCPARSPESGAREE
jgi:putative transposase